jgi:hypothetical protein
LSDGGNGGRENRRAPRFLIREKVVLQIWGLDYSQEGTTVDFSAGGAYVKMDQPFPHGTRVVFKFPDLDQAPEINGEVVYSRGDAQPGQGKPNGVGIQFTDLTQDRQQAIEQMVQALVKARGLVAEGQRAGKSPDAVWEAFLAFSGHADAEEYYAALGVDSTAKASEILAALQEKEGFFSEPPAAMPEARKARLKKSTARIEKVRSILLHPQRRLEFDVIHGHKDPTQAFGTANAQKLNIEALRLAFRRAHPEHARQADVLSEEARKAVVAGNHELAHQKATQSLEHDPFDERLRMAMRSWSRQIKGWTGQR